MGTATRVTAGPEIPQVTADSEIPDVTEVTASGDPWEDQEVTDAWEDLQKRVTDAVLRALYIDGRVLGRRVG